MVRYPWPERAAIEESDRDVQPGDSWRGGALLGFVGWGVTVGLFAAYVSAYDPAWQRPALPWYTYDAVAQLMLVFVGLSTTVAVSAYLADRCGAAGGAFGAGAGLGSFLLFAATSAAVYAADSGGVAPELRLGEIAVVSLVAGAGVSVALAVVGGLTVALQASD